jgi:hypothetical protein
MERRRAILDGSRRRLLATSLACLGAVLAIPQSALAVTCGQAGTDGKPTSGQLTLDTEHSRQSLDFKDKTDPNSFSLYFKVGGCTITDRSAVKPTVRAPGDSKASLGKPTVSAKGSLVVVDIDVQPKKFPAKQVKPVLTLSGDTIDTTLVSLEMQRKEPAFVPALISLLAALAGGVWALFVARSAVADKRAKTGEIVTFNFAHGVTAIVAGLVAAYAVFKTSYLDPPTWEIGFVPVLALVVGVAAAAAGGAAAGAATAFALAKQSRRRKKKRDEAEAAAADSGAATEPPAPQ